MSALGSNWYKNVNPNLDRLTQLLGRAKPSHGYTIAEKAPEIVTAPGVYFPAEKGEVIPLEGRQYGGDLDPDERLKSLNTAYSYERPVQLGTPDRQTRGLDTMWYSPISPFKQERIPKFLNEQENSHYGVNLTSPPPEMDIKKTELTEALPGARSMEDSILKTYTENRRRRQDLYRRLGLDLESRAEGGPVIPDSEDTLPKDNERAKLQMLSKILSMVKPAGLETKAGMGMAIPPEPMKMEQSKYDILKSAISILKPPPQAKENSSSTSKSLTETAKKPRPSGTGEASTGLNETGTKLSPTGEPTPIDRTNQYLRQMTTMFSRADGGNLDPATFEDPEEERRKRIIETDLNLQREPLGIPERTIPTESDRQKEVLSKSVNNDTRGIAREPIMVASANNLDEFNRRFADQPGYPKDWQAEVIRGTPYSGAWKTEALKGAKTPTEVTTYHPEIPGGTHSIATPQGEIPVAGQFAGLPFLGGQQLYKAEAKESERPLEKMRKDFELLYPEMADKVGTPGYAKRFEQFRTQEQSKINIGVAGAEARGEAYGKNRPLRVIDLKTFRPVYKTMRDQEKEPDRYVELTEGSKAERQVSLIEDIRGGITNLRKSITNPKLSFDEPSRMAIFKAVDATDPKGALSNLISGQFGKSLSEEQQNFLADTTVLVEQMMAMRSVLGAGQGSEDLRRAIKATVPGRGTFSKDYAMKQLDKTEKTLNRLSRGVLNVPLRDVGEERGQGGEKTVVRSGTVQSGPNKGKKVTEWSDGSKTYE